MSANAQAAAKPLDTVILLLAIAAVVASIVGFYHFSEESVLLRAGGVVLGVALAGFLISLTAKGKVALGYIRGSRTEVRKVVWPSRQETLQTTLIVVVFVLVLALFLWGLDAVLTQVVQYLTGRGDA